MKPYSVPQATREEMYGEAAQIPETPEERAEQQAKFRAWRADPRFERFWLFLDKLLAEDDEGSDAAQQAPLP